MRRCKLTGAMADRATRGPQGNTEAFDDGNTAEVIGHGDFSEWREDGGQ